MKNATVSPENQSSLIVERSKCNHVEQCEELARPSPVELNKVPKWLRRKLRKRFGSAPGHSAGRDALSNALWRLDLANNPCAFPSWCDHWGRSHSRGAEILVCEPYEINGKDFAAAVEFARQAGLQLVISPNASWHPGHIRLEFHDAEGNDEDD